MYNRTLAGRMELITHNSKVLEGNPLSDPTERQFPVYLPPGYSADAQPYPVLYALAGFTGTGPNMINYSVWDETLPEQIDDLIASEKCPPAIVVMPDCFTRFGGSQYLNSPAMGRYEDYLIDDLVRLIDQIFNTRGDAANRAVMGKSSGGYGALTLAMKHPDIFAV
ncbi:alpha/beta hydrolase, partial [Candidatus Neomarinimicrobiota bacterium]